MYTEPMKCHILTNFIFGESRLDIEDIEEQARNGGKKGIRFHNSLTSFFLRLFGKKKIVDVKDITGRIYHLNRESLSNWIRLNGQGVDQSFHEKTDFSLVTEYAMVSFLRLVVQGKAVGRKDAEKNIKIAGIINEVDDIRTRIKRRDEANRPNNWSIFESQLDQRLAQKLDEARSESIDL